MEHEIFVLGAKSIRGDGQLNILEPLDSRLQEGMQQQ